MLITAALHDVLSCARHELRIFLRAHSLPTCCYVAEPELREPEIPHKSCAHSCPLHSTALSAFIHSYCELSSSKRSKAGSPRPPPPLVRAGNSPDLSQAAYPGNGTLGCTRKTSGRMVTILLFKIQIIIIISKSSPCYKISAMQSTG